MRVPGAAGKLVTIVVLIGAALAVSALFYSRSRSADFDRHAEAVAAIGRFRHLDREPSEPWQSVDTRHAQCAGMPPVRLAITGTPIAIASATAFGRPSFRDG